MADAPPPDESRGRDRLFRAGCVLNVLALAVLAALCVVFLAAIARQFARDNSRGSDLSPADERAIRKVLDAQAAAWNGGDLDGFMAGYWKDDGLTFTAGDVVTRGWQGTRDRYVKKYFTPDRNGRLTERGELAFEELQVEGVGPGLALVRGRYVLKRGGGGTDTGRFTLTMRKFADGWKVTSDHTSGAEKPAGKS
jgi:beta-aspartyl-peptidase (threonine type)